MIIFGTTSTRKLLGSGQFRCPQCDAQTRYEKRRAKRWGHLYWIPILPMDEFPPYVECMKCKGTFIDRVLEHQESEKRFQAEFERAAGLVMARMVLADGEVKDEEKVTMADVLQKFVGRPVDRDYVDTLIAEAQRDSREPEEIASSFAGSLNPRGAEVVVKAALHIAMSDGDLAKAEVSLLSRISSALGMTSAHFRAVMEETLATPPDNGAGNSAAASVH